MAGVVHGDGRAGNAAEAAGQPDLREQLERVARAAGRPPLRPRRRAGDGRTRAAARRSPAAFDTTQSAPCCQPATTASSSRQARGTVAGARGAAAARRSSPARAERSRARRRGGAAPRWRGWYPRRASSAHAAGDQHGSPARWPVGLEQRRQSAPPRPARQRRGKGEPAVRPRASPQRAGQARRAPAAARAPSGPRPSSAARDARPAAGDGVPPHGRAASIERP